MVSYFTPFLNCATGSLLARPDSATTHENRKVFIDLLKNDSATSGKVKLQKFGGASSKTGGGVAKVGDVIAQKKTPFGLLKLKLAPDGSVVFEPNKALAALKAGQVFKTSFTYTIADADGHLSSAVVKLNIKGLNDGPTVLSGQGSAPTPVFELADASAQDIWLTGSFRVSDLDKGDILTAKVVGGPVLAYSGGAVPGGSDIHALTDTSVLKFTSTASNGGARTIGWTYDPGPANLDFLAAGETLTVSFQVRITDGHAKAPTQTLTFTIVGTNDAATISGHHAGTVYEDGDLYAVDVDAETLAYVQAFGHAPTTVGGDLDIADKDRGEAVFRKPAADALHGEYGDFAFNETTGAWTYTLDEGRADKLAEGQKVTETLTVTSKDGTAHETIVVTIYGNNDAATFTGDDAGMVTEDFDTDGNPANGVATTASGDLHATDVDSAPDFVVGTVAGQYGSLTIGADGKWTYTLDNGNPVVDALNPGSTPPKDTIVVTTVDGTTHEIAITINGANDAPHAQDDPTAVDDALATPEDQAIVVDALANDTDVDGDALVITSATAADPSTGTASVVVQGGKTVIVFTPAENYHGPAVVNYTISDGHGGTDTAVVKVTVKPVNDAPSGTDKAVSLNEDSSYTVSWSDFGFSDPADAPSNNPLSVKIKAIPGAGTLTLNNVVVTAGQEIAKADIDAGKLKFAPAANANGDHYSSFTFQVRDDGGTANGGADLDPTPNTLTFNVTPVADAPDARPIDKPLVPVDAKTNVTIVLDVSGSMDDSSGLTSLSRLDVAKAAINELLEQYDNRGDAMIQLVTFSGSAQTLGGGWMSISAAKALVAALSSSSGTNYDAALAQVQSTFGSAGKFADGKNVLYFLSDGEPQQGDNSVGIVNGAGDPEVTNWENFLSANKVTAYALGIGSGLSAAHLSPIAYDGALQTQVDPILVTDLSQLQDTLVAAGLKTLTGNLLTDSSPDGSFGPDGPGYIKSITVDGSVYTYNPAGGGSMAVAGADHGAFDTANNTIAVTTALGGKLTVDMDDGNYTYLPPAGAPANFSEKIGFSLVASTGLTDSDTLTISATATDSAPIVRDDHVITNAGSGSIDIPVWALLFNDTDVNADAISFDFANGASGGTVSVNAGVVSFSDTGPDGGSFSYQAESGAVAKVDTAVVTIDQDSNTIDGTGLGEILVGRDTKDDKINGYEGHDVLIGHGGDDQLDAGAGNDLIWGGKGADILTGGAGKDAFLFTKTEDSNAANGIDRIVDFEPGIDKINLSGIDAKTSTPADDAFSFVAAQSGVQANKVTWKQFDVSGSANDYTLVQADVNGDGTADFEIRLTGLKALTASDFVL